MGMKLINLPKSKQFKIVTRFYDPQQEVIQEREQHIKQELGISENGKTVSYGKGIKGSFRRPGKGIHNKMIAEARSKSNMRLIYMLIILTALFYFFLK